MSVRLFSTPVQQQAPPPVDAMSLLIVFIIVVVGVAVAKDPKLALPIGTAAAVAAVLIAVVAR
ncbi:hypothetical protein OG979_28835 [Actinomadura citrea]|uniref:hypothetical protein n=1 Tax=Actinomadura citrea TaxID=46158 RepID=UPI002E2B01D9|nr:hypothetical protein [Actinomadura citrea]